MFKSSYNFATTLILCGLFRNLQTAQLICLKGNDTTAVTLQNPTTLLNSSCFNSSLLTIVYVHGFIGSYKNSKIILDAYKAKQDNKFNVIALDWEKEAANTLLEFEASYALSAVPKSVKVGKQLCKALIKLAKARNGIKMNKVHLVGHSLGAQLMGYTGRCTINNGYPLPRITGLDPANQLFHGDSIYKKLDRNCACFVDIVHTNPGGYGINESSGTVDLWPNYNSDGLQPGCPKPNTTTCDKKDLCSHNTVIPYYVEAIQYVDAFIGSAAPNYATWLQQGRSLNDTTYLGEVTRMTASGNYYLVTNNQSPYGRGEKGAYSTGGAVAERRRKQ